MTGFDGNDYRKRVLATIEARGGVQTSDPFEFYDLPLRDLHDAEVAAQVEAVWGFWQKQRNSPKYRGLVTALLEAHRETAPLVLGGESRRRLVEEARRWRVERDAERFGEFDSAVERLVERFGGIPESKLEGLRRFAAQAGLSPSDVEAHLRAHPVLDTRSSSGSTTLPEAVRRQVRSDLDELGRLLGIPPPVTLYDLLGLPPGARRDEVARERQAAAARNRALRPDRRRALVDDLLAAVTTLLLEGDPQAYLDAVAEDVSAGLRPRVAAAVLVEDTLTAYDLAQLVGEAQAAGLDRERALRVLEELAREAGVSAPALPADPSPARRRPSSGPAAGSSGAPRASTPSRHPSGAGSTELAAARAALRAGRAMEAQRLVEEAHRRAGELLPPIRAAADDVAEVLAETRQHWRAVEQALVARRFHEAAVALQRLVQIGVDVFSPGGMTAQAALQQARAGLEAAEARRAQAVALDGPAREAALLAAVREFPDAEELVQALRALPVQPARDVRAERSPGGVLVRWRPSSSTGEVEYRVLRIGADDSRRAVGTTRRTELEDGEAPRRGVPTYAVVARRAGVQAAEALSGSAPATAAPATTPPTSPAAARTAPPHVPVLTAAPLGRRVSLAYDPPASGQAQVRRLPPGGRPPSPGTVVGDAEALGSVVPAMGPGLAVDRAPGSEPAVYVVITVMSDVAVVGAASIVVELPPVDRLRVQDDRLLWDWPLGLTETVVSWRRDGSPTGPHDPQAVHRKITNTRYDIDGGFPLPSERPLHLAIFTCVRQGSELLMSFRAPSQARLALKGPAVTAPDSPPH